MTKAKPGAVKRLRSPQSITADHELAALQLERHAASISPAPGNDSQPASSTALLWCGGTG
jgi:hypothetical protein